MVRHGREIIKLTQGNFPYFPRPVIVPPNHDFMQYRMSPEESLDSIAYARDVLHLITPGTANLARGLILYGGIAQYPGGMGLNYSGVYKEPNFMSPYANEAIKEIAQSVSPEINCILAPERSAIRPAQELAKFLKVPLLVVKKNGYNQKIQNKVFGAYLDSYTHDNTKDLLYLSRDDLKSKGKLIALLFDDIIDTGMMSIAIDVIVKQARDDGVDISLLEICALLEKGYTGGRELIKQETGIEPKSGLIVKDIGLFPEPWMTIQGVNEGSLSFFNC